jgi:hypothetical protein
MILLNLTGRHLKSLTADKIKYVTRGNEKKPIDQIDEIINFDQTNLKFLSGTLSFNKEEIKDFSNSDLDLYFKARAVFVIFTFVLPKIEEMLKKKLNFLFNFSKRTGFVENDKEYKKIEKLHVLIDSQFPGFFSNLRLELENVGALVYTFN